MKLAVAPNARWFATVLTVAEYLLGFFAIAAFAAYAFAHGKPADERWQHAFLIGGGLAVLEVGLLVWRRKTWPTAWPKRNMKSGVIGSCPTVPRMPSVPK